jgi:cytochrome c peroxidase
MTMRGRRRYLSRGCWAAALTALLALPLPPSRIARAAGLPPRPERTAEQRSAQAASLRRHYQPDPATWPAPLVAPGVEWRELGPLPVVDHPADNPFSEQKAALGRVLFHDPRLSRGGTLACVSCHEPNLAWADGRIVAEPPGRKPRRNTPSIMNAAFEPRLFWDGRAANLEDQVAEALTNAAEMAARPEKVEQLLSGSPGYRRLFAAAFPDGTITFPRVVAAVACFERTVVGGESRFDDFLRGKAAALTDAEVLGLDLFRREARCLTCHHGPTLSDGRFHNLGLSYYARPHEDLGRHTITHAPADTGLFRTPGLRNVTRTGPYMHNGMFDLEGVLRMYNAGMVTAKRHAHQLDDPLFPVKSPLLQPLGLNRQDLDDLAAFLAALEEPRNHPRPPELPEIPPASGMSPDAPR